MLQREYGPQADVWSLGVCLFTLLSGLLPFFGETEEQVFDMVQYAGKQGCAQHGCAVRTRQTNATTMVTRETIKIKSNENATPVRPCHEQSWTWSRSPGRRSLRQPRTS